MNKKRIAVVKKEKCIAPSECPYLCKKACPVNRTGKECIVEDVNKKVKINEELCIGCSICIKRCPTEAISIINLPEILDKPPVHRYGENEFALFNLPVPIFGKVVGVLGRNGIGKSTAIKILAGVLTPNLGDLKKKAEWDDLIEYYKGTEAQIFFEKVRDGKIKISYKPQTVDMIPKMTKGKVKDLLKKVDEKNEYEKIIELLDLKDVEDIEIDKISGGELQRVAIAATVLKKANFYVFDEPSSYLDIKQRLKIASFIRNLADKDTAVMVVEHDLIILDYITDLVHILYGKEGVYGITSLVRSTKEGINVYLEGYLKEENIRFRDTHIKFSSRPEYNKKNSTILTYWKGLEKRFDNFTLIAEEGDIYKNQVIGILGENGIGKTSFAKLLAGVEQPDKGEILRNIKISYKPQYIDSNSENLVLDQLKEAIQHYDVEIIRPLNLKPLFMKKLNQLSGGELQRVAIAYCLSQEADLYLLDEPSAYLDVEQRLLVSKMIKELITKKECSAMIIDHDLLFIDYLSDSLIVFEGKPAINGYAKGPYTMEDGMNKFLKGLQITFRRDPETQRPRTNKQGSQLDMKQKKENKLYYK